MGGLPYSLSIASVSTHVSDQTRANSNAQGILPNRAWAFADSIVGSFWMFVFSASGTPLSSDLPYTSLRRLVRHDDRAGGGEHTADTVTNGDFGVGIWVGAVPRIWRTLSCSATCATRHEKGQVNGITQFLAAFSWQAVGDGYRRFVGASVSKCGINDVMLHSVTGYLFEEDSMRTRDRTGAAGARRDGDGATGSQAAASTRERPETSTKLMDLVGLLDHAVKQVPAAGYFWGVVAASATVAIISRINGLNKVTFIAILAAFIAMFIFYVFSRMEKSTDAVVKLVGHALLIISGLAFIFVIITSAWLALSCRPRLIAYLYGVSEVCSGSAAATSVEKKTAIYRGTIRRNGTWEGRDQITPEEASHLGESYEIVSIGDPPRAIEINLKNGSEFCPGGFRSATGDTLESACSSVKACVTQLSYKQDGTVDSETRFDQFGNLLEEMVYPSPSVGQFVDAKFPCDRGRSGIQLLQFERVASGPNKGLDELVRFLDNNRHPKPNDVGNYGWRNAYDGKGHVTTSTALGPQGENWGGGDGVAIYRHEYNDKGLEVARSNFSPDDQPTSDKGGIARQEMLYDKWGNEIEVRFIDLAGKLTLNDVKVAGLQRRFDERGNPIETADFGIDKGPTLNGKGYAGWRSKFDERGNEIEEALFGIDGQPILSKDGYAGWRSKFDERGNKVESAYFGVDGRPLVRKDGYAVELIKYDERGNQIETRYLGVDRNPLPDVHGAAIYRDTYYPTNKKLTEARFGTAQQPILNNEGIAWTQYKYDEHGNEIERAFFGARDRPILSTFGYAGSRAKFDEHGNEIEVAYFGVDDKAILSNDGYAGWRSKFDEHGNEIEVAYFGVDDKPMVSNDGYAGWRSKFDARDNQIEVAYFSIDNKPIVSNDGYAGWRSKFDERGNQIEIFYFGIDGQPTLNNDGYAGQRSKYDERGHQIEVAYFGIDDKPILEKEGYAIAVWKYDSAGREEVRRLFDVGGKPVRASSTGRSIIRTSYDQRNLKTEESSFDELDRAVDRTDEHWSVKQWLYDGNGQLEKTLFRDKAGNEIPPPPSG
jgi:hypothetical protein